MVFFVFLMTFSCNLTFEQFNDLYNVIAKKTSNFIDISYKYGLVKLMIQDK